MDAFLGILGLLIFMASFIFFFIFGIIFLVRWTKKQPKRRSGLISIISIGSLVIGIIFIAIGMSISQPDGYITHQQYRDLHEGDKKADIISNIGNPYKRDNLTDEWIYKFADSPHKGEKVLIDFDGKSLLDKQTQSEYDKSVSDTDDSDIDSSDSSTNEISLSKAKTADQLMEAAAVADPDDFQKASIRNGIAVIELKDNSEWSEKTTVQNFALHVTDLLKKEKDNPNFNSFAFIRKAKFTDEKGNEKTETAIIAYFTKKNAQSISYDNFSDIVNTDPYKFYDVSDGYYLHPAIYKKVEKSFNGLPAYKNSKDRKLSDDFASELADSY